MITQIKRMITRMQSDIKFTPFQKKVYKIVLNIPAGETRTYKWVAAKVGNPRAYRAVGQALKSNPHTIAIPCHRVIRSNGAIGGYSKGHAVKKFLLKKEKTTRFVCHPRESGDLK